MNAKLNILKRGWMYTTKVHENVIISCYFRQKVLQWTGLKPHQEGKVTYKSFIGWATNQPSYGWLSLIRIPSKKICSGAYPGSFSGQLLSARYSVTQGAPMVGGEGRNIFTFISPGRLENASPGWRYIN